MTKKTIYILGGVITLVGILVVGYGVRGRILYQNDTSVQGDTLSRERRSEIGELSNELGVDLLDIQAEHDVRTIRFTPTGGQASQGIIWIQDTLLTIEISPIPESSEESYGVWIQRGDLVESLGEVTRQGDRYLFEGESQEDLVSENIILIAELFTSEEGGEIPPDFVEPAYGTILAEIMIE